ncbi:MAG: hypothetical protein K0R65_2913 [Crocinitomicaceae bacterium]|jgi:uncharacterized membrane protein YgdD (TMEM256/DUF423 family)|nr:hypothetical protein [Crocinitomicaceae bacterium]
MSKFQKNAFILGAVLLLTGIVLGAFGAHGLEGKITQEKIMTFEVGVRYQVYHGFGFLFLGLLFPYLSFSLTWVFRLMLLGVILFSGSIYLLATNTLMGIDISKILGPVTPLGGLLLIISWALLIVKLIRQKI